MKITAKIANVLSSLQLRCAAAALAGAMVAGAGCAAPAVPDLSPEHVLRSIGVSRSERIVLAGRDGNAGVIASEPVSVSGASGLRLHFSVVVPGEHWIVTVRDANRSGAVYWSATDKDVREGELWSDPIPAPQVIVELSSSVPGNTARMTIDRVVMAKPGPRMESWYGDNQMVSIREQDEWIVALGQSVARLRFVADEDGKEYVCTAFLVANDLLLTNNHCIASDTEMRSALVDFDYDAPDTGKIARLDELVQTNAALDYSVLRLQQPSGRAALKFAAAAARNQDKLLIVEHPSGTPKMVSIADCKVIGAAKFGTAPTRTDFGHGCDTEPGSSGSPVFNFAGGRVVGLHHLGFAKADTNGVNQAVHIGQVYADFSPALRAQIAPPQ